MTMFTVRVCGSLFYFYSLKFSDDLLDDATEKIEPSDSAEIQKLVIGNRKCSCDGFSLLSPDHCVIISPMLDAFQQIISEI